MKVRHITLGVVAAAAIVLIGLFVWQITNTQAEQAAQAARAAQGYPESCDDPGAVVQITSLHPMTPEWVQLAPNARAAGGGYTYWGQHSIRRCGDGEAQITVQTRYARDQLYGEPGAGYNSIIRYTLDRTRYRLKCDEDVYAVVDRQIIGPNEEVYTTAPGAPDDWKPRTPASPVGGDLWNTACRGS